MWDCCCSISDHLHGHCGALLHISVCYQCGFTVTVTLLRPQARGHNTGKPIWDSRQTKAGYEYRSVFFTVHILCWPKSHLKDPRQRRAFVVSLNVLKLSFEWTLWRVKSLNWDKAKEMTSPRRTVCWFRKKQTDNGCNCGGQWKFLCL